MFLVWIHFYVFALLPVSSWFQVVVVETYIYTRWLFYVFCVCIMWRQTESRTAKLWSIRNIVCVSTSFKEKVKRKLFVGTTKNVWMLDTILESMADAFIVPILIVLLQLLADAIDKCVKLKYYFFPFYEFSLFSPRHLRFYQSQRNFVAALSLADFSLRTLLVPIKILKYPEKWYDKISLNNLFQLTTDTHSMNGSQRQSDCFRKLFGNVISQWFEYFHSFYWYCHGRYCKFNHFIHSFIFELVFVSNFLICWQIFSFHIPYSMGSYIDPIQK